MDSVVDKTLSMSPEELRKKAEKQVTLMEALAIKQPERKVCFERTYNKVPRVTGLVYQRSTHCGFARRKGKTVPSMQDWQTADQINVGSRGYSDHMGYLRALSSSRNDQGAPGRTSRKVSVS